MRYHSLIRFLLILFLSGSFGLYGQSVFTVTSNADSGPGTLRAAFNNAAPNDTIRFAVTGRIELTSGDLSFNNSLVIDGPGANLLTISGDSTYTVFSFPQSGPYNLDISDLTIQGGRPTGLDVSGYNRVRLNGVTFRRNYGVQSSRGGGANVWCTTAEMYNCTFVENLLTYTVGSTPTTEGAGAFVYANRLMMDSCRFEKNTGSASTGSPLSYGSGLYFFPTGSNQKIYISNTVFIENRAFASNGAGLGVGLAVRGTGVSNDGGLIQLENCEFDSNSVFTGYMSGVAIHIDAIDTVIIKGTSVHGHLNGGVGSFGAVFSRARKLMRIENSVFRNNQADNGAAVYMRSHIADSAEFEMDGCLFEGNIHYGGSSTGAIDVAATKNIKISRSRFINNTWTGLTLGPYRGGTEIRDCEFAECPRWDFEIVGIGSSGNPASIHLIENCSFSRTTGFSVHVRDMNSTPNFRHCTWADCYSYMYLHGANSRFTNCIFSYTTTPPTTPVFIFGGGNVLSGGGNISRGNGLSSYLGAGGDLHNTNPQLQALAFNGGPTRTFAIAGSSLAVNHGGTGSLITDQRGYIRDNQKDTGAFEYNAGNPNQVQVVSQSPSTSACTGDNLVLTLTVSGPGPISYQWTFNGSNLPGQNQVNLNLNSIQPAQAGNYTCVVNNGSNADTSSVIAVQVFALPTADAGANQTICAGQSATLTATGGTSYTWNQGLGAGATKTVSPASTTTYAVTVTNTNNCSATDNVTVTVNALPTANAGTNQSICAGQSATLSASGGTSYTWNQGLGAGATQTVSPTNTTTYTVTVTNANNCSATDDIIVTVNALPTANAGANQSICAGQSATLSASGGTSYTWNQGLGAGATQTVSPSNTTTYTVTVTNAANCSATDDIIVTVNAAPTANAGANQSICAGQSATLSASGGTSYTWNQGLGAGANQTVSPSNTTTYTVTVTNANNCSATDDIIVTVNALPSANAGANQSICAGQSATLSASGGTSYTWNQGLGAGANQTVSPTNTTTYTVTVTNANNCSATADITVTVNAAPAANAGVNQSICVGQSATLNASGGTSYTWNQGLGGGASHTVSPTSSTTYTVTVTNANNCTATDDITVTVNPLPSANAGSDQTICEGQSVTLNATGSGTYTWSQGLGAGATHSVSPTTSTTYTVTVTNANNCTATDDITVTVNPIPAANAGPDVAICAGQSANLGASGGSSYNWNQGLGAGASQTVSPSSTTTYTVTVTNANNCSATDDITVTVNPLPTVSFSGLDSVYCTTDAVVSLVGSPSGGVFSGNGVSGQSFDPALAGVGTHSVQYDFTDVNGCSANSSISTQVSVCTGIASGPIGENPFEVYPNPFQTTLNVRFLSQALSGWSVNVVDLHGKALHIGTTEEADLLRMDFSRLSAGIYFLLIEGDGQRYQEKVVKVSN